MFRLNQSRVRKSGVCALALCTAGMHSACAGADGKVQIEPVKSEIVHEENEPDTVPEAGDESQETLPEKTENDHAGDAGNNGNSAEASAETEKLKEQFGENCITEQTFKVGLSEYEEEVYFVPYHPVEDGQAFFMQIVRDGEILTQINGYVPESLEGERFGSLDAVSFFDINFDGNTDIVLIETYGDTTFAAVYYGVPGFADEHDGYFWEQGQLSDRLTESLDTVTISKIRGFLSEGKKNGEFSGYQEAYESIIRLRELENSGETEYSEGMQYDLIDFDGDDIPELVAGVNGYHVSLYTYSEGSVYVLMDSWAYGAMGNAGFEYSPGNNSLRNYNADYAGAINYLTYMTIGQQHSLEQVVQIVIYNFDDVNGNGIPDEEEQGSIGYYGVNKIDGREVTAEECAAYDLGGYEYIEGKMSAAKLLEELGR